MTDQISPAQQGKAASSDSLAKISSRFLSETAETRQRHQPCRAILFLMDNPELSWITRELCQILKQRGFSSRLCHLHETSNGSRTHHKHAGDCNYWLVPTTSTTTVKEYNFDHVVLLVPANLEAVLTAYQHIKRLAQRNTPDIGVVLVGPRDQHSAWHYFRKLAVGALRYLDIPLLNLGFLPEQVTPEHGPANHQRNNFLAHIGERLLRSEFYTSYPAQRFDQGEG
jgi:hypothetical protein